MDPWYDYLAIPVGPLLLVAQVAVITSQPWRRAVAASVGFVAVFVAMTLVVAGQTGEADANIGLALLALEAGASAALLVAAAVRRRGVTG